MASNDDVPVQDTVEQDYVGYLGSAPSLPSIDSADTDSAVDTDSIRRSTASVRTSIFESVEENGRTYHRYKQGQYPLPNDEAEQDRLDLQHELCRLTFNGKLFLAPITERKLEWVLDIGTGTGIWAIEFAQEFPETNVIGTDLSPIQPVFVPPKCQFEIDDAEEEWVFSHKFDFIHGRALVSCFRNAFTVIKSAFEFLEPGGYLELQDGIFPIEYVGEPPVDSSLYKWMKLIVEGATKIGRPWTGTTKYKEYLIEAGFEDVVEKRFYWPIGPWAKGKYFKTLGIFCQEDLLSALEGVSLKLLGALGWSKNEIDVLLAGVRDDIKNKPLHGYIPITLVYGRKPLNA
ncbi:S-adenosyl-L-methionine-dependent methyltransferase [Trichodelitschia bisporula]|uniref:S-adenosyl-L-methionine-dependent methyltransferase n=1 Tax=Trichodelitschia bisporula TaxID=703511 RepID=A0A6G1HI94_9PEZI|nr:S-adenosyl-L-methionine-dependent methyltransferase [Trichodelitschia bisporula]